MRDLLLRRPVRDVDLALEGESAAFAAALAKALGARATIHPSFGTATLNLPGGFRLDIASARRETYAYPGALPAVSLVATLEEDLLRRDFPIHAIAMDLSRHPAALVDPCGGRADLAARRIRFLHPVSPADDPTRALRAVRYAHRLGFRIAPEACREVASAIEIGAFDAVSGDRLRREVELLFSERRRSGAVAGLLRLGLDRAILRELGRSAAGAAARVRAAETAEAAWLCYLLAWMGPAPTPTLQAVAGRLALAGAERAAVARWASTRRRLGAGVARLSPSRRRARAEGLSKDEILAGAALREGADRRALHRLAVTEPPALSISGSDLLERGVAQGPAIGRALAATRAAREDGRISAKDELAFALARARRGR